VSDSKEAATPTAFNRLLPAINPAMRTQPSLIGEEPGRAISDLRTRPSWALGSRILQPEPLCDLGHDLGLRLRAVYDDNLEASFLCFTRYPIGEERIALENPLQRGGGV
jgi:hypothetical protein